MFDTARRILSGLTTDFSLKVFVTSEVQEAIEKALDRTQRWHQRDCPLKAPFVIWFVIALVLFRAKSILNVLVMIVTILRVREPELELRPVTQEAVHHARMRLGWKPLWELFKLLAERIVVPKTFRGLRLWAMDGISFTVPDTKKNEAAFGRPGSARGIAAFPQMKGVALVATQTHQIKDCVFGRYKMSERSAPEKFMKHLNSEDLVMTDRGFPSAVMLRQFLAKGIHILCRIGAQWKPRVVSVLGPGDSIVEICGTLPPKKKAPKKRERRKNRTFTLRLRLLEYQIENRVTVRLLTDLLDPVKFPAMELALLYHQRWEIEKAYKELRTHLGAVLHGSLDTDFRSKTPTGILQEAYAMLIVYNLIRGLMIEAGCVHKIDPLKISFVSTLQVVELAILRIESASPLHQVYLAELLLQDIAACKIDRPCRKRAYPRKVRIKMSRFQLKRPGDREQRCDFASELRLVVRE
jgi:hypothetical protein